MGNKLFVGGLSWDTTESELQQAFAQYGEVLEAKIITDRDTGRSRGFGFVTFGTSEEAARATQELNESTLDGRTIRVNEANERTDRGGGGGGGNRGGGGGGRRFSGRR